MPVEKTNNIISKLLFITLVWLIPSNVFSQIKDNEEKHNGVELHGIIYTKQFQAGISLNTNGYSLNARRSWSPTAFFERGLEFDIAMIRHPKEVNDYNYYYIGGNNYAYGKLNSLYTMRFGFGEKHEIAEKIDVGSVEINYFYYGGLALGGVKPIYLEINKAPIGSGSVNVSTERYDPNEHNLNNIVGGVPFTKGFSEMQFYPGIYAKFGLDFDYKISTQKIGTLEAGMIVDYYFREVPIMAKTKNYSYFLAFYLSINFGKKWN